MCPDWPNIKSELTEQEQDNSNIFRIYMEQTSHHPPISHILIESPLVEVTGHIEAKFSLKNTAYIDHAGPLKIKFKDT